MDSTDILRGMIQNERVAFGAAAFRSGLVVRVPLDCSLCVLGLHFGSVDGLPWVDYEALVRATESRDAAGLLS